MCRSFESLYVLLAKGAYEAGAVAAAHTERLASLTIGAQHHAWMRWVRVAMELAEGAEDNELMLRVYERWEGMLLVPCHASDDDAFVRLDHALLVGIDTPEGERALRGAFTIDALAHGASVQGFISRWLPPGMEEELPELRRILSNPVPCR